MDQRPRLVTYLAAHRRGIDTDHGLTSALCSQSKQDPVEDDTKRTPEAQCESTGCSIVSPPSMEDSGVGRSM